MGETKPLPQLAIGLAIGIEEDESLVHDGQLGVDDFLDAMDALILIAHDVIGELVVLLDLLEVSYDLVNLHLPNPSL
jgi:hypothetical protein